VLSAPHLLSFRKDVACSLEFHHSCTCNFILLLMSLPLSPVGPLPMSYCSKKVLTRTSLTSTRFLYSYDGAPRGWGPSQTPQILVKKCFDTLSILSLVTCSRLNSPPGCRTWLRPTTSSSRETLRSTHTVSNEQHMYRQHKRMRVGTFLTLALTVQRTRAMADW